MTKRRFLNVLIVLAIVILSIVYYIYDGAYVIETMTSTELELINKYATYKTPFSDKTIVKDFVLANDADSHFWRHDQYIHATLLVPNDEIDTVFPSEIRRYDMDEAIGIDLVKNKSYNDICFYVLSLKPVAKWLENRSRCPRKIIYNVFPARNNYTKVYLSVSKLGYKLYEYK